MKRSWLTGALTGTAIVAAVFTFAKTMHAQGGAAPTGRIACVNIAFAMNEYDRTKDFNDQLAQARDKLEAEEKTRRDKIDILQAELERLDPAEPTAVERYREMVRLQVEYKNWGDFAQLELARESSLWTVRIYQEAVQATEEIAQREGYDLVLFKDEFQPMSMEPEVIMDQISRTKLIYANPSTDISQLVLDKLNVNYRAQPKTPMLQMNLP